MFRHRLAASILVLSLLLFVLTALTWMRSQRWADTVGWAGWKDKPAGLWHGTGIMSQDGDLVVYGFSGTWKLDDPRSVGISAYAMQPHFLHQASPARILPFRWDTVIYNQRKAFRWQTHNLGGNGRRRIRQFSFHRRPPLAPDDPLRNPTSRLARCHRPPTIKETPIRIRNHLRRPSTPTRYCDPHELKFGLE